MIGFGEYRIEYYGSDGAVVATDDTQRSVGAAQDKAKENYRKPDINASRWVVVRCVLSSLDS